MSDLYYFEFSKEEFGIFLEKEIEKISLALTGESQEEFLLTANQTKTLVQQLIVAEKSEKKPDETVGDISEVVSFFQVNASLLGILVQLITWKFKGTEDLHQAIQKILPLSHEERCILKYIGLQQEEFTDTSLRSYMKTFPICTQSDGKTLDCDGKMEKCVFFNAPNLLLGCLEKLADRNLIVMSTDCKGTHVFTKNKK